MIPARNAIDAHAQNILVNNDLLLLILKTFSQCTRSLLYSKFFDVFSSCVVAELSVTPTSSIPVILTVASSPLHCARPVAPCRDQLVICGQWICLRSIFVQISQAVVRHCHETESQRISSHAANCLICGAIPPVVPDVGSGDGGVNHPQQPQHCATC